jgi:ribonuclease P protein component
MDTRASPAVSLPRSRRIKQGRDFFKARTQGRRLVQGCLILNWLALPAGSTSRVGVITTRKLGNAVVRARARRLLREAFRQRQPCLAQPVDVVLIARSSVAGKKLGAVDKDFVTALKRAGLWREPEQTVSPDK